MQEAAIKIDMSHEIYYDIPGYEGYYQISNFGNVKSLSRIVQFGKITRKTPEKILKLGKSGSGYTKVNLYANLNFK